MGNNIKMQALIAVFTVCAAFPAVYASWNDCVKEQVNCPRPGECGKYTDTDNDNICDHSQPSPEQREAQAANEQDTRDIKLQPREKPPEITARADKYVDAPDKTPLTASNKRKTARYRAVEIGSTLFFLYFAGLIAVKRGKMSISVHRKIWNIILLAAFIVAGFTGLLLVLRVNYGISVAGASTLSWHVEAGVAMGVVSVFHVLWHLNYYICALGLKKGVDKCENAD